MFNPFTKNLESPRDALDIAVRDAILEIEAASKAAETFLESVPLAQEINSLPLSEAARDVAARAIAEWVAALRRCRFTATFETSTRGFRTLRDQMRESVKRLVN